jgi:hypothetical protein
MVEQRQTALAKRFASYFLMEVDGTFKTNDWYLTLAFAVGITNNDKTCPIACSYVRSESEEYFQVTLKAVWSY